MLPYAVLVHTRPICGYKVIVNKAIVNKVIVNKAIVNKAIVNKAIVYCDTRPTIGYKAIVYLAMHILVYVADDFNVPIFIMLRFFCAWAY